MIKVTQCHFGGILDKNSQSELTQEDTIRQIQKVGHHTRQQDNFKIDNAMGEKAGGLSNIEKD